MSPGDRSGEGAGTDAEGAEWLCDALWMATAPPLAPSAVPAANATLAVRVLFNIALLLLIRTPSGGVVAESDRITVRVPSR